MKKIKELGVVFSFVVFFEVFLYSENPNWKVEGTAGELSAIFENSKGRGPEVSFGDPNRVAMTTQEGKANERYFYERKQTRQAEAKIHGLRASYEASQAKRNAIAAGVSAGILAAGYLLYPPLFTVVGYASAVVLLALAGLSIFGLIHSSRDRNQNDMTGSSAMAMLALISIAGIGLLFGTVALLNPVTFGKFLPLLVGATSLYGAIKHGLATRAERQLAQSAQKEADAL